jgi:hypothetical protein
MKYWKSSIRKMLHYYSFLISPGNGLFAQYLDKNATNYSTSIVPTGTKDSNLRTSTSTAPINFILTKVVLGFFKNLFNMSHRLAKYTFTEELMLYYIRTHYISFIRLYNKNFTASLQFDNLNAEEIKKGGNIPAPIMKNKALLILCKLHLKCLFSIAKNRSEETRRKLF